MKTTLIILISIFYTLENVEAQDVFFIEEKSFKCTEEIVLKSNDEGRYIDSDLTVRLGKDSVQSCFIVSVETRDVSRFTGKLIIYLDDGAVLTSSNIIEDEYVDNKTKAVFSLTNEQIESLRTSNINSVRYTLEMFGGAKKVNQSASNSNHSSSADFPELINKFYK